MLSCDNASTILAKNFIPKNVNVAAAIMLYLFDVIIEISGGVADTTPNSTKRNAPPIKLLNMYPYRFSKQVAIAESMKINEITLKRDMGLF